MVKEPKNVDFYTSGRQPSEEDFGRISEWIKQDKKKRVRKQRNKISAGVILENKNNAHF